MLLHLDQAKLTRVLFTLRFAKFTQRFDRIDLSHTVAQQFVSSQACSHHVVFPLRGGRVSRSDHIFFLRKCLHMFRRQTRAAPGMFQRVDCLQNVGESSRSFHYCEANAAIKASAQQTCVVFIWFCMSHAVVNHRTTFWCHIQQQ